MKTSFDFGYESMNTSFVFGYESMNTSFVFHASLKKCKSARPSPAHSRHGSGWAQMSPVLVRPSPGWAGPANLTPLM